MTSELKQRLKTKALKTQCKTKVVAIGYDKTGRILNIQHNKPRFSRKGGGLHAEELVMKKSGKNLHRISIMRVGRSGDVLPIEPCVKCSKLADKLGVILDTLEGD